MRLYEGKLRLRGVGEGELELLDDKLVFNKAKGLFRRRREQVRSIDLRSIKGVKSEGGCLVLVWKDGLERQEVLEVFSPQTAGDLAELIKKKIKELIEAERECKAVLEAVKLIFSISYSVGVAISSCNGLEGWSKVEELMQKVRECSRTLADNLSELSSTPGVELAALERSLEDFSPVDFAKSCHGVLKELYAALEALSSMNVPRLKLNFNVLLQAYAVYLAIIDLLLSTSLKLAKGAEKSLSYLKQLSYELTQVNIDVEAFERSVRSENVEELRRSFEEVHEGFMKYVEACI